MGVREGVAAAATIAGRMSRVGIAAPASVGPFQFREQVLDDRPRSRRVFPEPQRMQPFMNNGGQPPSPPALAA